MAGTSAASPATERRVAWPGPGWLRIGVLAGLVGGLGAAAFNGALGERVLGEAIRLEEAGAGHATVIAEPFTRGEQQGGMVVGELVLGAGLGLLLAGAALVAGAVFLGPVRRAWLILVGAGAWAFLVLPAVKYPALPPGVESTLPIETRQLSYLALVGAGLLGVVLARLAWLRLSAQRRGAVAVVAFALPAVLAVALLPAEHTATAIGDELLLRFRAAAIGSQAVFWALTALAGLWLLEHRLVASLGRLRDRSSRAG
jgi:hypothetical protein